MVPDMDLNSSFASRIVREELTETRGREHDSETVWHQTQRLCWLGSRCNTALGSKFPSQSTEQGQGKERQLPGFHPAQRGMRFADTHCHRAITREDS